MLKIFATFEKRITDEMQQVQKAVGRDTPATRNKEYQSSISAGRTTIVAATRALTKNIDDIWEERLHRNVPNRIREFVLNTKACTSRVFKNVKGKLNALNASQKVLDAIDIQERLLADQLEVCKRLFKEFEEA